MNKKVIIITLIAVFLILIIFGSIAVSLVKDFGINSLGKSIVALYRLKTNKDIDYVEINENIYMVKNKEVRKQITFIDTINKENMEEQILEPTIFEIYKDKKLYSIVKVRKGI